MTRNDSFTSSRPALSMIALVCCVLSVLPFAATAQVQSNPPPPLDPLLQLMITQPSIEVTDQIQVTATFDPPVVPPGGKSTYRVTFNALGDSVEWPSQLPVPPSMDLRFSARGQILIPGDNRLRPITAINYHARAQGEGSYTVPAFDVQVYGRTVQVPAARLEVSGRAVPVPSSALEIELSATNVYVGQPVPIRVLMRAGAGNLIQGVQDMRLNGDGFLVDLAAARQSISVLPHNNGAVPTYVYETTLTPLVAGDLTVSAQGFTAGNRFAGQIVIQGQVTIPGGPPIFRLIDSDPVVLHARPLSREGALPGFTGAIGHFQTDTPRLSTTRLRAGDTLKLYVTIRSEDGLVRLVPPPPPVSEQWQVFPAEPGGPAAPGPVPVPGSVATTFTYTLVPLTTNISGTPVIPFSYYDPDKGQFVAADVPSVPVTVLPGVEPLSRDLVTALTAPAVAKEEAKLELNDVTEHPGRVVGTLVPLQFRGWFVAVQLIPAVGFLALWRWDRRRRYLELHPEIVRRRRARRALRRERRRLDEVYRAKDEQGFITVAVSAMRIATAPHFPAEPRALVAKDVMEVLGDDPDACETARRFFVAADNARYGTEPANPDGVHDMRPELDRLLENLEARL